DEYHEQYMEEFGVSRQVCRNDNAIASTIVGGQQVYSYGTFVEGFGSTVKAGRFLAAS
ncbi:hypothetical protein HGK65_06295, partial [Mycobacteroides abscessus]|nr:hypothetical protein [Mycobacteroides abscessus]